MKKIKYTFIVITLILVNYIIPTSIVKANSVNSLNIDINVNQDGTAKITENWDVNIDEEYGMVRLGNSNVSTFKKSNLTIIDDEGTKYKPSEDLVKYHDLKEKNSYYLENGNDLYWGIGESGEKKYTIQYDMQKFVIGLEDSQITYYQILSESTDYPVNNISLNLHSDYINESDFCKVWIFDGIENNVNYENNHAIITIVNPVDKNTAINVIIEYKEDFFIPTQKSNATFIDATAALISNFEKSGDKTRIISIRENNNVVPEEEEIDNEKIKEKVKNIIISLHVGIIKFFFSKNFVLLILNFLLNPITFVLAICAIIVLGVLKLNKNPKLAPNDKYVFETNSYAVSFPEIYDRIPCGENIYKAFWIVQNYICIDEVPSFRTNHVGIFGALLFKYIYTGKVKLIDGADDLYVFDVSKIKDDTEKLEVEEEFENILIEISKDNNYIIDKNTLDVWYKNNTQKYNEWIDKAEEYGRKLYEEEKIIMSKSSGKYMVYSEIEDEVKKLYGFKKMLTAYKVLAGKNEEFKVDKYKCMIFSHILGISKLANNGFTDILDSYDEKDRKINDSITNIVYNTINK